MRHGIQTFCKLIGESGCYALCLIDVAEDYLRKVGRLEKPLNVINILFQAVDKNYISYDWNNPDNPDNFYVKYPGCFLEAMTGKKWEVRKESPWYQCKDNEFKVNRWERVATGTTYAHFDREEFHPLSDSLTVKYGNIKSTRICKVLN